MQCDLVLYNQLTLPSVSNRTMSNWFEKARSRGMLNIDSVDVSEMVGGDRDKKGTWCSSRACCGPHSGSKRGVLVAVKDNYLHHCPKCHSPDYLFHDTCSEKQAEYFGYSRPKKKEKKLDVEE